MLTDVLALEQAAKVIIISGQGDKENALSAVEAGAHDFLTKPVSMDELSLILQRCIYPIVNEGCRILEEGIVERPSDLDVIWLYGYGFPRYRGGPMFYADLVGVGHVHETLKRFHEAHPDGLEPAPLLERLAKEGGTFAEWSAQ